MSVLHALLARCHVNPAPLSDWEADFLRKVEADGRAPSPRQIEILERIANRVSPSDLARMLSERVDDVALHLKGDRPSYRHGAEIRYGARFSMSIVVKGDKRGSWIDHESGQGGDALALVAYLRGHGQADAIDWAKRFLGIADGGALPPPPAPCPVEKKPETKETVENARAIWREAIRAVGSPVERYLASRSLTLPATPVLRFHPACPRGKERLPAMIALLTDASTGEPRGIHRTFLRPDGSGKADGQSKMMLGNGGVVRLVPDENVTTGLGIAEGIETAMSAMQIAGWVPVWAATSAGAISTFPVLDGIECLTIFSDADQAGEKAARACTERWTEAGREVTVHRAPAGCDWNDVTCGRAA